MIDVLYSRENDRCIIPTKRDEDAGRDLYVDPVWLEEEHGGSLIIKPQETVLIPTGIRSVIPITHYAQLEERGSTGTKAIKIGAGVVDSGYRGIWNIVITNCSNNPVIISEEDYSEYSFFINGDMATFYSAKKGLAQFVFIEVPKVKMIEVSSDVIKKTPSERGCGKLGASGK